jgi:POT family proton-dependent oligopeptide transporter
MARIPKGLPYIIGNELAERFSYYGMKTILIVFMTQYLMIGENEATQMSHNFNSGVYFFTVIDALQDHHFF